MSILIPDNILEILICSFCHKYLSVKPVKVYPNRLIQCGRCVDNQEPAAQKSQGVESLYGLIAEHVLFKCVNKFDGCRALLTYSQVLDHEKECLEKIHKCPICYEEMTSFLMLQHFHFKHKNAVLGYPTFVFNLNDYLDMPSVYIYQEEDNLFFLYTRCSKSENTIALYLVCMASYKLPQNIYHQFTVTSENKEFDIVLDPKPCTDDFFVVDISHMSNFIQIKFKLIDRNLKVLTGPKFSAAVRKPVPKNAPHGHEIGKNRQEFDLKAKCVKCQAYCIFSLSNCPVRYCYLNKHNNYMCYYCYQWFESWETSSQYFEIAIPSEIFGGMKFYKWNCSNCFSDISVSDMQSHEISCKLGRQFRCPMENCCEKGTTNQMIEHLKDHNRLAFSSPFQLTSNNLSCYVFLKEHIVSLLLIRTKNSIFCDVIVVILPQSEFAIKQFEVRTMFFDSNNQILNQYEINDNINPIFVKIIVEESRQ
ncbi:uncharacterized protein LOC114325176 [Diabrotica virgifera virgifera]|uniref:Uncharacterized protein LOC114325176 n=1 Tax=Diabrotica virgifera virgifera TaxID=50390 RepID=A0A6P7F0Y4_DIAVI|nr:uncharacterized protein LOC114325176 [Diabrotica virgifera virgifera]